MRVYAMNGNYANYTRKHYSNYTRVWVYDITLDGQTHRVERPRQLDYKATCKAYYGKGYKQVYIKYINTYTFN